MFCLCDRVRRRYAHAGGAGGVCRVVCGRSVESGVLHGLAVVRVLIVNVCERLRDSSHFLAFCPVLTRFVFHL